MTEMLKELNSVSPFTWEIQTDGTNYTILCEGLEVHDPESGTYLTNIDKSSCEIWVRKILDL